MPGWHRQATPTQIGNRIRACPSPQVHCQWNALRSLSTSVNYSHRTTTMHKLSDNNYGKPGEYGPFGAGVTRGEHHPVGSC